jgi:hypothetical protein
MIAVRTYTTLVFISDGVNATNLTKRDQETAREALTRRKRTLEATISRAQYKLDLITQALKSNNGL